MIEKLEYFKDPNFVFNEEAHSYIYKDSNTGKPIQIFEPVSGFVGQFHPPENWDQIAGFSAKKRGLTKEEVLNEWAQTAKEGTDLGSWVHKWIEDYYNGLNPQIPKLDIPNSQIDPMGTMAERQVDRILKFQEIYDNRLYKLNAVGQEIRLFSRRWGIAGTLDALFELNGKYYVGDWKTNKKFTTNKDTNKFTKKMLAPFNDLWDNSLNGYSIQISTYRLMLEEAGFQTEDGFLIWLGPKNPELHKALDLRSRIREFLDENNFVF